MTEKPAPSTSQGFLFRSERQILRLKLTLMEGEVMGYYLSPAIIKAAVQRLCDSRDRDGMVHFLLLKSALVRANANDIAFSSNDEHFTGGMKDLAATYPPETNDFVPANVKPFVKIFGTSGAEKYVSSRWTTNGPADALSGPRWNSVIQITGSRPRRGSFKPGYEAELPDLLLKAGQDMPSITDAAVWYHRAVNLETSGVTIADVAQLDQQLRDSFQKHLQLTNNEIAALFDTDAKPLDGIQLTDILSETVANPQDYLPDLDSPSGELDELLLVLESQVTGATVGLQLEHELLLRFIASLSAKHFLILTGLSGSGKTKLAQAFSRWLSPSPDCYRLIPVGADWTGNENILGYPNGLDPTVYITKPALDLILHARGNPNDPHFLILDEMNLSHVERYFADILSAIESEEAIHLHLDGERSANGMPIPPAIELPKNLFIIGTVNVDETTYMFSPKVLDRANVIEFRMATDDLKAFLTNPGKPNLAQLDGKGAGFGPAFVTAAAGPADVPADVKDIFERKMLLFFQVMQPYGAEFGYRVAHEAARFVHFYKLLGNHSNDENWFPGAFDAVVVQKFLPKLHGSRARLGPLLKSLWFLCVNEPTTRGDDAIKAVQEASRSTDKKAEPSGEIPADAPYPISAEKIARMWRLLAENGFASFAEA